MSASTPNELDMDRSASEVLCKHGNAGPRKWDHCQCEPCKSEGYARRVAWRRRNPEKVGAYSKAWNDRNPEKRRAIENAWRAANPEKVAIKDAKAGAAWSKKNRGARNALTAKRKAALLQRTPGWADAEKIRDFYILAARMTAETGVPHEVDHIFPLQGKFVSGLHVHNNLQVLPRSLNRAKHNRVGNALCS